MNKTKAKTLKNEEHRIWYDSGDAGEMWDFYNNRVPGHNVKEVVYKKCKPDCLPSSLWGYAPPVKKISIKKKGDK